MCCPEESPKLGFLSIPDVFVLAKESLPVSTLWRALGLNGEPKSNCCSPFRNDRTPSFSIFDGGRKWKDHATGEGGDVIEFVSAAPWDWSPRSSQMVRREVGARAARWKGRSRAGEALVEIIPPRKWIDYPAELVEGTPATWDGFARKMKLPFPAVWMAVQAGLLRFTKPNGVRCYCVTDLEGRSAEIRRIDGGLFPNGLKATPLRGVDKTWPVGIELLRGSRRLRDAL